MTLESSYTLLKLLWRGYRIFVLFVAKWDVFELQIYFQKENLCYDLLFRRLFEDDNLFWQHIRHRMFMFLFSWFTWVGCVFCVLGGGFIWWKTNILEEYANNTHTLEHILCRRKTSTKWKTIYHLLRRQANHPII